MKVTVVNVCVMFLSAVSNYCML